MKRIKTHEAFLSLAAAIAITLGTSFPAQARCTGDWVNPVTDVCWDCMFPLTVAGIAVNSKRVRDDPVIPVPAICACPLPAPLPPKVGTPMSFWEPSRVAEVVRKPFCFPSLDGEELDVGLSLANREGSLSDGSADWHVHWFFYPLLSWMELAVTGACTDLNPSWDVGYMTEIDPLWNNDELAFFLNPESILFANIVAQATCAADCLVANVTNAIDTFFWCAGCQGSIYPLSSHALHTSEIQSTVTAVEKMTYKLHRQLLARDTSNPLSMCMSDFAPVWKKGQYRSQPLLPVPSTSGTFACSPYGRSTFFYEAGKTIPSREHYAYLIWRKRLCCAF